ncbi:hypothetical protein BGZ51_001540 [Haplosporangium sp. Z 767]|nr:hypothetical protein BGZ50_004249 [Haplosporangium sp. Z 11]KAF9187091.1 hypothetical protein BGZ51_001540 [Haplosporangium sp. Z 767]
MAIDFQLQTIANSSNTLLAGKIVTVASLGIFAGTALTYSAVIMPSLRKFSTTSSVAIWHEIFQSAKSLQVATLTAGIAGSVGLYYKSKNAFYLYGAITMATVIPYTLLTLVPLNKKLFAIRQTNTINGKSNSLKDSVSNDNVSEDLLNRWSLFHLGRVALGFGALFSVLYGVVSENGVRFILFK